MKQKSLRYLHLKWQAAVAVLLFLFFTGAAQASFHDKLENGNLYDAINYALDYGMSVENLVAELVASGVNGSDIICELFMTDVEYYKVVAACLDSGMSSSEVAQWARGCGATQQDVQMGFSMAGESLPGHLVFQTAEQYEENAKEYLYNPPSPSK
jgi:hypothetical protein